MIFWSLNKTPGERNLLTNASFTVVVVLQMNPCQDSLLPQAMKVLEVIRTEGCLEEHCSEKLPKNLRFEGWQVGLLWFVIYIYICYIFAYAYSIKVLISA